MSNIAVFYGSTTGATQGVAEKIANILGADIFDVASAGDDAIASHDVLLLGSSTWGLGELQDDWNDFLPKLEKTDLSGKKVGVFGTGDQEGFGDTFVEAISLIHDAAASKGATMIGKWPSDGYSGAGSALRDGYFVGLPIDESNQSDMTDDRVSAWTEQVKSEIA
ncbi:MAG: flavodoxin [Synergistales bacterium]|nr:flavodoxin [Synergistales bacterium]